MAFEAERARAYLAEGLRLLDSLDRRSALCVGTFAGLYRETLDRIEASGFDVFGEKTRLSAPREARRRGARAAAVKVAVVGGGLAGLAAALDLVDAGHAVTVYEARPTLGGAVQTLPEREGDPEPPPDNGQHIALGCFTEYLRFLERVGEGGSYPAHPARAARARRGRRGRVDRAEPARASQVPAPAAARPAPDSRSSQLRCASAQARPGRDVRDSCCAGSGEADAIDRPVLGRLHPAGAQPPRATRSTPRRASSPSAPRCSARARTAT